MNPNRKTMDPERLRDVGGPEDRALLCAPAPAPSAEVNRQIRAAVEARVTAPRRRVGRYVLLVGATLFGGTALAFALAGAVQRAQPPLPVGADAPQAPPPDPAPRFPADQSATAPTATPAPPSPALPSATPDSSIPMRRRAAAPRGVVTHGLDGPRLTAPPTGWEPPRTSAPPGAAESLIITREGRRPIALTLAGHKLTGQVRDTPIDIAVVGRQLLGKLGDENVLLHLRRDEAQGTIANHEVGFYLSPTRTGFIVRGAVPAHTTRVETTDDTLAWHPGCDQALRLVAEGVYEGTCAGGKARVVLPPGWHRLPPLTRLILLSLLLPERDPDLPDDPPALFGPPDWPAR